MTEEFKRTPEKVVEEKRKFNMSKMDEKYANLLSSKTGSLTPKTVVKFCEHLAEGHYLPAAAALAGVSEAAIYKWMRTGANHFNQLVENGNDQDLDYDLLPEEVVLYLESQKAMAQAEAKYIRNINDSAEGGVWQAGAWMLERRFADRWGKRMQQKVEHTGEQTVTHKHIVMPDESESLDEWNKQIIEAEQSTVNDDIPKLDK